MSNDSAAEPAQDKQPAPRTGRPILPIVIVAVETIAMAVLLYAKRAEWLPGAEAFLAMASSAGLTLILLFLWFVFLAPVPRKVRAGVGIVGLVLVGAAAATIRVDNVTGDIVPVLGFRWTPRADETLGEVETKDTGMTVDLSQTTDHDYPRFLGAGGRATLSGVHLARDWTAEPPKKLWRQPIGAAWSAFAVVGPYAVTQEQRGDEELITCYEVDTGKARWVQSTPVRFEETIAGIGPRATPTIDEGKVYAMGAMGHVTCLDGATGEKLWQHDVVSEYGATPPTWGKSCSPLVYQGKVIISAGAPKGKSLVALDKNTGEFVWSGGNDASAYASPVPMTLCGVPQVVMANAKTVVGHDAADGHVLWRHEWPEGALEAGNVQPMVAQPVDLGDDRILLTKGYGTGSTVWQIKHEGDDWSVEPVWRSNTLKTKFTNAVLRDGYAYALNEGILECVDLATGRRKWKRGRYGHGQVLLVDDLLLVQSEEGDVALVEATPERFKELTRFAAISGIAWNPPALVGRKLLLRSNVEAACYELPAASP